MIISALKGGLGNQLFQYALGRTLSLLNSDELALDVSGLSRANEVGDIYRPFALDAFSIQARRATPEEIRRFKYPYGVFSKILRMFRAKVLKQAHIGWEPEILTKHGNMYLDGYWQSPKYFESIRDTLLAEIVLVSPLLNTAKELQKRMLETSSVFVHVRRGDYVTNQNVQSNYGTCSPAYYAAAIKQIEKRVQDPSWFVFSDDIAWVRENLTLPANTTYVSDGILTDAQELTLMSSCLHGVIANSSFSWWGAWLIRNPGKLVIAPLPWFDTKKDQHPDLIPDSWIRLPKN